jgi:PilZ domain
MLLRTNWKIVMARERRKSFRVEWNSPATIYDSERNMIYPCVLKDFSNGGAKISATAISDIPDQFMLRIASGRAGTRKCRVLWRTASTLGVEFADRLEDTVKAKAAEPKVTRKPRETSARSARSASLA